MEYTPLQFLENTYPSPNNYVPSGVEKTTLNGIYPEKNKIDFNLPSISELKYVEGTEFNLNEEEHIITYANENYFYYISCIILFNNHCKWAA